jgi:hypothetical protein
MTPPMARFNVLRNPKRRRRPLPTTTRERGPNPTHNTSACKVLLNRGGKDNWKKKDASESKHSDCKSKHKKKHAELNLLQKETKKEKAKWTKAHKRLKSKEADNVTGKESESSDSEADEKATAKSQTRPGNSDADSDSSSDSSSSSYSNSE